MVMLSCGVIPVVLFLWCYACGAIAVVLFLQCYSCGVIPVALFLGVTLVIFFCGAIPVMYICSGVIPLVPVL